jgi:aminopeptidase N
MAPDTKVRLADYRPFDFEIGEIKLDLDLDARCTKVKAKIQFKRRPDTDLSAPLILDADNLQLLDVRLDGRSLAPSEYVATETKLLILTQSTDFVLETEVNIDPSMNVKKMGLFAHVGKLVTHCEPDGFRAITYFPDRPDMLATYEVTLHADRGLYPVLLSNGDCIAKGQEGDRHWATWRDPHRKPSYIFAAMAGDFGVLHDQFLTSDGRSVSLAIFAEHGQQTQCQFAMASLKKALTWERDVFGLDYDLSVYNIVALAEYAGAQENKGLNLFGADGIIADPQITTDEEFMLIQRIIGHEAFHNWTGNRVTCRDWFQLSLKEGLTRLRDQLFMEDMLGSGSFRIDQVKALRRNQFPEDDGPASHPIQPIEYVQVKNFYTNTIYDKGAEVLRMLRVFVGEESFSRSIKFYLDLYDGQAVTVEELILAFEQFNGIDLGQFRLWVTRAGRPTVTASSAYEAKSGHFELTLSQSMASRLCDEDPMSIPIGFSLIGPNGEHLVKPQVLILSQEQQTFSFEALSTRPTPSLLRGFSAPVTLVTDLSDDDLAHLVAHDDDPFVAWDSAQTLLISKIRNLAAEWRSGLPLVMPPVLDETFSRIISDTTLSASFRSRLLGVPDEPVLSEGLARIDLDAHMAARAFVREQIGKNHREGLLRHYQQNSQIDPTDRTVEAMGQRMMKSTCLDLLTAGQDAQAIELCLAQLHLAPSMTEQFDALTILSDLDTPLRRPAMERFLERYRDQSLVVDKWFKAMALSRAPGVIDDILDLEAHPFFDINNTARVLNYFGSFFRQNRVTFHDVSGKGYRFLAHRLLMMDKRGGGRFGYFMPQIDQWRRYDQHRQDLMRQTLEQVASTDAISIALKEAVSRLLD